MALLNWLGNSALHGDPIRGTQLLLDIQQYNKPVEGFHREVAIYLA